MIYRSVKDELRETVLMKLKKNDKILPEIKEDEYGVKDKIIPALVSKKDILLMGQRGCGKTETAKAIAKNFLGEIEVVKDCVVNDDPKNPKCPWCINRIKDGEKLDEETKIVSEEQRFKKVPAHGEMRIGELLGSVDPVKTIREGYSLVDPESFAPGALLQANRRILFVDDLTAMPVRTQIAFNNFLDSGEIATARYPIKFPVDCLLIAAANPYEYQSLDRVAEPLRDRVEIIRMGYPKSAEDEREIMLERSFHGRDIFMPRWYQDIVVHSIRLARKSKDIDQKDGVSVRATISSYEHSLSYAEVEENKVPSLDDVSSGINLGLGGRIAKRSGFFSEEEKEEIIKELVFGENGAFRLVCCNYRDHIGEKGIKELIEQLRKDVGKSDPDLTKYKDIDTEVLTAKNISKREFLSDALDFFMKVYEEVCT